MESGAQGTKTSSLQARLVAPVSRRGRRKGTSGTVGGQTVKASELPGLIRDGPMTARNLSAEDGAKSRCSASSSRKLVKVEDSHESSQLNRLALTKG